MPWFSRTPILRVRKRRDSPGQAGTGGKINRRTRKTSNAELLGCAAPMFAQSEHIRQPSSTSRDTSTLVAVRRILAVALVVGLLGTGTELLLLGHTEDAWQLVPLILIGVGLVVLVRHAIAAGKTTVRALQATMILFVVSGAVGTWLHYAGNMEFELEMYPTLEGTKLFGEAMTGATPALAPGTMIGLGMVGLAYAFRHPRLGQAT